MSEGKQAASNDSSYPPGSSADAFSTAAGRAFFEAYTGTELDKWVVERGSNFSIDEALKQALSHTYTLNDTERNEVNDLRVTVKAELVARGVQPSAQATAINTTTERLSQGKLSAFLPFDVEAMLTSGTPMEGLVKLFVAKSGLKFAFTQEEIHTHSMAFDHLLSPVIELIMEREDPNEEDRESLRVKDVKAALFGMAAEHLATERYKSLIHNDDFRQLETMSGHIQGTTEALESASATDAAGDLEKWIGDMPELIDQNAAVFDKYIADNSGRVEELSDDEDDETKTPGKRTGATTGASTSSVRQRAPDGEYPKEDA